MKITLLVVGKTEEKWIKEGIEEYSGRIRRYLSFEIKELPSLKNTGNLTAGEWKLKESEKLLQCFSQSDHVVLLDERGAEMRSVKFAGFLAQKMNSGIKNLVFVVGGPYGFDESVRKRAASELSLSKMTFSHQMVRLFFTEQIYRAMTILKNESYHHE